ncbi:amino acid/amide ABC transporter membrane protein 2, HAAT family (TC 3.A.1.4.-) [Enhydrobacter aerosaccus]|uniref:Amino acid/amide ABC transporter membrane protein 2, HAAT family (TC 3.A.1.4.-) n=1 Tax=Enhydrobacter aerosaccus TaxID=225324 RepID=A0A1T4KFE4_9HYPH|nr:branched-chain amino acid ABC transporter permease [Enhydrobacter aerosaccus]SJZ41106.1 amino acid/amide ABC transporter membrane protein 2, HAAT family (TC 3.A.1.4.-) [Enhydrobacter aerosaccus]
MWVGQALARRARWRWAEIVFWLAAFAALFLPAGRHLILNEIAILALFALSLDLILGYAGIISLGHAAFLGLGAYAAGLLAKHVTDDPTVGLALATVAAASLGFATSFLVLRGSDLTRLMVTLGVAMLLGELANALPDLTGGADGLQGVTMGPLLGLFEFDLYGRVAYAYSLTTLFVLMLVARAVVYSPFGLSLMAIRRNRLRASALGVPVHKRLIAVYTLAAAFAGAAGALLAQTTAFVSLDFFEFHRSADVLLVLIIGGAGWLYGGILGAVLYEALQDALAAVTPEYWQFWIGLFLVAFVMLGRERLTGGMRGLLARFGR